MLLTARLVAAVALLLLVLGVSTDNLARAELALQIPLLVLLLPMLVAGVVGVLTNRRLVLVVQAGAVQVAL